MHARRTPVLAILLVLAVAGCHRGAAGPTPQVTPVTSSGSAGRPLAQPEPAPGVHLRVSDAGPGAAGAAEETIRNVAGDPLTAEELGAVLNRLPPLPTPVTTTFALREGPPPPKLSGEDVLEPFPPPSPPLATPSEPEAGALEVLRYQPEGDVEMASVLAVTFSQPMVPVGSVADVAAKDRPVKLEPEPPGQWRWVGTRTLLFEPEVRFPMATSYRATVPAGTTSGVGGVLAADMTWSFTTPPPKLVSSAPYPGTPTSLRPVLFMAFDQAIPKDAASRIVLRGGGTADVREATAQEIADDDAVQQAVAGAKEGRWLALVPTADLPAGASIGVVVPAGFPSAEGPLSTVKEQSWGFQVHGPFAVDLLGCDRDGDPVEPPVIGGCNPFGGWWIELSNPVDTASFDPDAVTIEPAIADRRVDANGSRISISGLAVGRTSYTVQLPAELTDTFGQRLEEPRTLTFKTGDAPSLLFVPGGDTLVLDPGGRPELTVSTVNHDELDVTLYRVEPADWEAYRAYADTVFQRRAEAPAPAPGSEVWHKTISIGGDRDAIVATGIDLSAGLKDGRGHVVAVVRVPGWDPQSSSWQDRPQIRWVQATDLGIDVVADEVGASVLVTSLTDGSPVAGARVMGAGAGAIAGADGLVSVGAVDDPLVVEHDGDAALLPGGGNPVRSRTEVTLIHTFDDRGLYRPGEEVHVKGWVRSLPSGLFGDLASAPPVPPGSAVSWTLRDQGRDVAQGTTAATAAGGFDLSFTLPDNVNVGTLPLEIQVAGSSTTHSVNVQEFRRPEYEVTVDVPEADHFIGDRVVAQAAASYYAGGPLPGADVTWLASGATTQYAPPGHDDFHFGRWIPWWWGPSPIMGVAAGVRLSSDVYLGGGIGGVVGPAGSDNAQSLSGQLDAGGEARLAVDVDGVTPLSPATVSVEADVTDVNRQTVAGRTSFLVHPARVYAGVRTERWFYERGKPIQVDLIVADLDGQLVSGSEIRARLDKVDSTFRNGAWQEDLTEVDTCVEHSGDAPVSCTFNPADGGSYRLTTTVFDDEGRRNETEIGLWVAGGQPQPRSESVAAEQLELVPDKDSYQPGDTAEILVRAPFSGGRALVTIRRAGRVESRTLDMAQSSLVLRVPIADAWVPNVHVGVDVVGAAPRGDADGPTRPALATGTIDLPVPPLARTLDVGVAPDKATAAPGSDVQVTTVVRDANGQPVAGAEVTLVVADEAVLALTGYKIPNPLDTFYPERDEGVWSAHSRELVQLATSLPTRELGTLASADSLYAPQLRSLGATNAAGDFEFAAAAMAPPATGGGTAEPAPIAARVDFNPLAAFEPSLITDASGRVATTVHLPDSTTRYRITAVATDGGQRSGMGDAPLVARLPLTLRTSPPRFLNFGDVFELPVVVQNLTAEPLTVDVAARGTNLTLDAPAGRRIIVPGDDRVEVRLPASAELAGTAIVQVGAVADALVDAQQLSWPVWTPATTEAFATYGELDDGAVAQPVQRPSDVVPSFGGLEVSLSSTALSSLTDAFLYLQSYPYECAEQVASRLLATVSLEDVLRAFNVPELPSEADVDDAVRRDQEKLQGLQSYDGGFQWWADARSSDPFVTVHVTHALARAMAKGRAPDANMVANATQYLVDIDQHLAEHKITGETRRTIKAYALYVRKLLVTAGGGGDPAAIHDEARRLFAEDDTPSVEVLGWLLYVLADDPQAADIRAEIQRQLNNRVSETASTAQFTTQFKEDDAAVLLASSRRADAIVLDALLEADPGNDLVPKIVRGLQDHRTAGRWASTQENGWVLVALDRYFRAKEAQTPNFTAGGWLDEAYLGAVAFEGRSPDRHHLDVPMTAVPEGTAVMVLAKEGPGRLYYRVGLRYAPSDLRLEPSENGFTVQRTYEAVDAPGDVYRDADGTWHVRPGARVRVRVNMVATARRYHVALVDPMPAGFEALNPALATTESLPPDTGDGDVVPLWYRWWHWWDHQGFRDERVEAFTSLLWEGVYEMSYVARATTPGDFVVPPAKAEEMYHPETFGRSGTDYVSVR